MKLPIGNVLWLHQISRFPRIFTCPSRIVPARLASSHQHDSHDKNAPAKKDYDDPWDNVPPAAGGPLRKANLNDFPIPKGSWQEDFNRRQRLGNLQMGLGLLFFGGTVFYLWYKDPLNFEKVFGPYKYMKNPPAFKSPVLEPNILREFMSPTETVDQLQTSARAQQPAAEKPKLVTKVDPSKIPEIPNHVPYLIVGGGTAAFSAFRSIRANEPTAAVLVISNEPYYPYMRPPLSKELYFTDDAHRKDLRFKPMHGKERSVFFEHEEFYVDPKMLPFTENGGVAVLRNMTVTSLDPKSQKVSLKNGWDIYYDRLLLATGGTPRSLPCLEKAGPDVANNITIYRDIEDFKKLDAATKKVKKVVIIGGGFLGSELACALAHRGKSTGLEVHQIFPEKGVLARVLPEYLSDWTTRKMQNEKVKVYAEKFVVSAKYSNGQVVMQMNDGQEISADHVVVAVGLSPNTQFASSAGLEVDEVLGGYKVNAELAACENIWVAGDVASFFDVTLGRRRMEHHDHAIATGRVAGENMVGKKNSFWHQSMFWSDLGPEIGFEAVGLVDSSLDTVAVFAQNQPVAMEAEGDNAKSSSYRPLQMPGQNEEYSKGVIFYLKDKIIVGVLLWNLFDHVSVARKVIKEQKTFDDLSDLAKLFDLHEEKNAKENSDKNKEKEAGDKSKDNKKKE
ncbi:apoptosis-inducing factor 1, mitochondrial-like isoform X2 [Paramacrobiotus metropolitanus]|uniref:apoptosis-inducing factor 1, mitochondrial-like isoform X2 n=1 Tax=Paramacrobiotus metropolitanus TaxID=2943436 RepID=UPI0024462B10|nr:apoptosis-inducing factor 1, mitochondrial-like isoform X2 [Paramacrobiotus metropolitanus]